MDSSIWISRVNKLPLNEEIGSSDALGSKFSELMSDNLKITQNNIQTSENHSYIDITTTDSSGNRIQFKFDVEATEGDQDGMYNIVAAKLTEFNFKSTSGIEDVHIEENDLNEFNQRYQRELLDVATKYADFESNAPNAPEIDQENSPEPPKIDQQPVAEPETPEIDEEEEVEPTGTSNLKTEIINKAKDIVDALLKKQGKSKESIGINKYKTFIKKTAVKLLGRAIPSVPTMNEDDNYPKEIGNKFKSKSDYPKAKKKRKTTTNISEDDNEETDELLGYKSHNVGDEETNSCSDV
jgi:hypothetical protein